MKAKDLTYPFSWEERKPVMGDQILFVPDHYFKHEEWEMRPLFSNDNPVYVEYCSGNGEWILDRAFENPEVNWIAVEVKFDRVQKIYSKMRNRNLTNVLVVSGYAEPFTRNYLPKGSVDQIFINFPDPWPKKRHIKNRLIQGEFVLDMAEVLKPSGKLVLVTDDTPYAKWSLQQLHGSKRWFSLLEEPYFDDSEPHYGSSYFDRLWREKGRSIKRLELSPVVEQKVDLSLKSRLNFPEYEGERILWRLDFGFEMHLPRFRDQMTFESYRLGVKHFLDLVYDTRATGFLLYDGPLDFTEHFFKNELDLLALTEWLHSEYKTTASFRERTAIEVETFSELSYEMLRESPMGMQLMRLYSLEILSDYLHRLAAFLPDEVAACVRFDTKGVKSEAMVAQLLSKERFAHLHILGREELESPKGICLPPDDRMGIDVYDKIDAFLNKGDLRIIPEGLLNESWQCLDEVIVIREALTKMGYRMVEGFTAAGGVVEGL